MAEWFYALTNVVFKTYSEPTPVPTPTPVTPAEYLGNMALTQTGDFLGMFAILLAGILTVGIIFFLVNRGTIKTKALAGVFTAIILCGAGTSAALVANGAAQKIDTSYVPERIEVLNHLDGSGWEFGQSPYGKEQVFTNPTQDKIITIDGLGIVSPDKENEKIDIGTWTCYSNDLGVEVFSGTIGTEAKLLSTITLYPGESTTFVWNSNISKEQALLLNETSPAVIGYRYTVADVPTPSDKHILTVNLNGGEASSGAQAKLNKDGWQAAASVETGEVFYTKEINNNYTKTEEAFTLWNSLLKGKEITRSGGTGNLVVNYKKEFIVDDVTANILWSVGPITAYTMEVHTNGGILTADGNKAISEAGWVEVASADKGSYWTKFIYGNTYTPADVFGIWQELLKSGDIYVDGGGKGTMVLPAVPYITNNTSVQIVWGAVPVVFAQGRASVTGSGYIAGIEVEVLDKDINVIFHTTTDENGYYRIPMNMTEDDQYIRFKYDNSTKHFTCPDVTFSPHDSQIDPVQLLISTEYNLEVSDYDSEEAVGNSRVDIFLVDRDMPILNSKTNEGTCGFSSFQAGILTSPVYHCLTDNDGKLTVNVIRNVNESAHTAQLPYVLVSHEGYNMVTTTLMGYMGDQNNIKLYTDIRLTKIEKCYSITGKVADSDGIPMVNELIGLSPMANSRVFKRTPEIFTGITDDEGNYTIHARPGIDGELCLSTPSFSQNMPYYVKYIDRNHEAGTTVTNDIELTSYTITAHVSDNPEADYSSYSEMWTRIESSGYDLQARFYKNSDIPYALEGLWLTGQDEDKQPLWWEWNEEVLTSNVMVNLIWTKGASVILETQNGEEIFYTNALNDTFKSVNAKFQPALSSFVFGCDYGCQGKVIHETIMALMQKAKAMQGHAFIENMENYTLVGFDNLYNIVTGVNSIYCCWKDDVTTSICCFYAGDATYSTDAQEYLSGKGYSINSETSVEKSYPLGTEVEVPKAEFVKAMEEYQTSTGSPLFTTASKLDVFVDFDELPGKQLVSYNDFSPIFKLSISFKASGSGHVEENGKAISNIELFNIPGFINDLEIDGNTLTIHAHDPYNKKAIDRTFVAVGDSGTFSNWDTHELTSSFIWYSATISPVFSNKVNTDDVVKEAPAENALSRGTILERPQAEAEVPEDEAVATESAIDKLADVADDEATSAPIKWATTALWYVFGWFMII